MDPGDDIIVGVGIDENDMPNSGDTRYAGPDWDYTTRLDDLQGLLKVGGPDLLILDGLDVNDNRTVQAHAQDTWAHSAATRPFFNGTFLETFDALVTSDGATVTMSFEQTGGGDLTMMFSDGDTVLDCTPALTIALTVGSDIAPQENFIYILKSTKVLTKSTSDWPSAEHIKVAYFLVPSAGFVQTDGVYINQNWNDHASDPSGQGHMSDMSERLRLMHAIYHSGVDGNGDGGTYIERTDLTPDTVYIKSTAGIVLQMHRHAVAAFDSSGSDEFLLPNSSVNAYETGQDLYNFLVDASGGSMSGKYYNLVLMGVANKSGEYAPFLINLPTGSYNKQSDAEADVNGYDVYAFPGNVGFESSTVFLIARLTMKHSAGGQNLQLINTVDLRGRAPLTATGGVVAQNPEFADSVFKIFDETTLYELQFQLSALTGNRTLSLDMGGADRTLTLNASFTLPTDPNADRILFWDDSETATAYLTVGTGLAITGTTLATDDANIDHDALSNFVANEHIDHTAVTLTAGTGLSGGGDISANRTFNLSHLGIEALVDPNADRILFWDDSETAAKWLTPTLGIQIAVANLTLDINGLVADGTPDPAADYVVTYDADGATHKKVLLEDMAASGDRIVKTITQAAHGLAAEDVVKYAAGAWSKAQADSAANAEALGIVESVDGNDFDVVLAGYISIAGWGLTENSVYFLDDDTAGLLTETEPTDVDDVSKPMMVAISATEAIVMQMRGFIIEDVANIVGPGSSTDNVYSRFDGTDGDRLQNGISVEDDDGIVTQSMQSGCKARLSGAQTITTATWTKLTLATEIFDVQGEFDNTVNYRFTVTVAGKYMVAGITYLEGLGDGKFIHAGIYVNGALATLCRSVQGSTTDAYAFVTSISHLAVNDYVELYIYHDHGGNRTAGAVVYANELAVAKVA